MVTSSCPTAVRSPALPTTTTPRTTTLFTALESPPQAKHTKRRRRAEFLDFMNDVIADYPDRQIHVVLDNLKTHKPKRDRADPAQARPLPLHPDPRQLAQPVEIWCSILARSTLDGASFTSVRQLRAAIDAFITAYNATAIPFQSHKAKVHPKSFTPRITDL